MSVPWKSLSSLVGACTTMRAMVCTYKKPSIGAWCFAFRVQFDTHGLSQPHLQNDIC